MHLCLSSTPNDPTARGPKRIRRSQHSESRAPTTKVNRELLEHRRISKSGKQAADLSPVSTFEALERSSLSASTLFTSFDKPIQEPEDSTRCALYDGVVGRNNITDTAPRQKGSVAPATKNIGGVGFSDLQSNACDDYNFVSLRHDSHECQQSVSVFDDDDSSLDDDLDDSDLLKLVPEMTEIYSDSSSLICSPTMSSSSHSINSKTHTPSSSANTPILLDDDYLDQQPCNFKKFLSPVTSTIRLLAETGAETHEPIARSPFPSHVNDRSPIIGLTSYTLLRVCFRIGEAINQCSWASKSGKRVTVELYARILDSTRDDHQQHFTFCDLYHARPPYIRAKYNAVIWKHVPLFDYDSKRLLQEGKMCRCIGTMKRDEKEWNMTIVNIWEATWEDVEWSKGIVDA
jgi:hypothetical protein